MSDHTIDSVRAELRGSVFQLGPDGPWETRERYCSGDVVGKLEEARRWAALDGEFTDNVAALEGALPPRVRLNGRVVKGEDGSVFTDAGDHGITVPFGASWVGKETYIAFLRHLFPAFDGWGVEMAYVAETATWVLSVSSKYLLGSVENLRTYGTPRVTAIDLIECGLRLQVPVVYDTVAREDGEGYKQIRNEVESALAGAKLAEIRDKWIAWLPRDDARADRLEDEYNRRFNRVAPRKYDGSRLTYPGLSLTFQGRSFELRAHQRAGVLRIVERGEKDDTCMLAYYPGAGKTACAIVGIMKRLQLGLSQKCVVVAPKSVLHQWSATFRELYPGHAEWLLVGTDHAFEARNRRAFLNTAALGDARIVLLSYEQFRTIPLQPETFRVYLKREVDDLERAMVELEGSDDLAKKPLERAFKQRQKSLANFEAKYEAKWEKVRQVGDADVSWEMWGCDLLVWDEFHACKNLGYTTRMVGVSGLPRTESQRAFDGLVKTHWVTTSELLPGLRALPVPVRGRKDGKCVALTGTPVTNSLAETWIMMKLLQPRLLREVGLWQFDAWAATFTTQVQVPEMDAVGNWRTRTRLKFHNLPELQDMLGLCWDRVDPATVIGTRPSVVGGRMRVVEVAGSDELKTYTQELADRAEEVKKRSVEPTEDNMLKITHDGRCASVFNGRPAKEWPTDGRRTKIDALCEVAWEFYCHSDEMDGVQLVFVDLFTPKMGSEHDFSEDQRERGATIKSVKLRALAASGHSAHEADTARMRAAEIEAQRVGLTAEELFLQRGVYGVIRDKMVAAGMLPHEVAYIHDAATDEERRDLFARANSGKIRVLIGSTQKMGLGVNVQRLAYAAHHVTVPWRPDWLDQANKRVDRDGNTMEAVHLVCYVTTGSYDVCLWQMIETKGVFVSQINSGTYAGRSADDIGDLVIDATTAKAVALGDLRVIEKIKLELELTQLQRQWRVWKNENLRSRFELESLPRQYEEKDREIADLLALKSHRDANQFGPAYGPNKSALGGFSVKLRAAMGGSAGLDGTGDPSLSWQTITDRTVADGRIHVLAESLRHKLSGDGLLIGQYRGLDLLLTRDAGGVHLEMHHGPDGAELIAKNAGARGVGAFATCESLLASLETQIHRLTMARDILGKRLDSLRADAPSWIHADRAQTTLAHYEEICAAVATAGIVDKQSFRFT